MMVKPDFDPEVAAICVMRHMQGRPVADVPLFHEDSESSKKRKPSSQPRLSTLIEANLLLRMNRRKFSRSNVKLDIEKTGNNSLLGGLALAKFWKTDTNIDNDHTIARNSALACIERAASCEETAPLGVVSISDHFKNDPNAVVEIWHDPECGHTWNFYKKKGEEAINYDSWLDGPALPASDASSSGHKQHSYVMFSKKIGDCQEIVQMSKKLKNKHESDLSLMSESEIFKKSCKERLQDIHKKIYRDPVPTFSNRFLEKTRRSAKKFDDKTQTDLIKRMINIFNVNPEDMESAVIRVKDKIKQFSSINIAQLGWALE